MEKEDQLFKDFMNSGQEENGPSLSFTPNVMRAIEAKRLANSKPLIGKIGWVFIAVFFVALALSSVLLSGESTIDLSELPNVLSRSKIMAYLKVSAVVILICGIYIVADIIWRRKKKIATS